jgi:hypothetical protein
MVSRVANPAPEATPRTAASGHLRRRSIRKTAVGTTILLASSIRPTMSIGTECPQSVVLQCGSRDRTEDAAHDRRERHSAGTDPDSALPPVVAKVNTVAGTTIEPNKIMEGRKLGFCVANSVRSGSKYAPMPASKTQANRAGTECVVGRHQKPRLPAQRGESPR